MAVLAGKAAAAPAVRCVPSFFGSGADGRPTAGPGSEGLWELIVFAQKASRMQGLVLLFLICDPSIFPPNGTVLAAGLLSCALFF